MTFKEKEFKTKNGNTYLINYVEGHFHYDDYVAASVRSKNKYTIEDNITNIKISLGIEVDEREIDIKSFEGAPTYVPYGSTNVMYDDGCEIDDIDCSNALHIITEDPVILFEDEKGNKEEYYTTKEMKELLKSDFKEVWAEMYLYIYNVALEQAQDYYEENAYDLLDKFDSGAD